MREIRPWPHHQDPDWKGSEYRKITDILEISRSALRSHGWAMFPDQVSRSR